MAVENRFETDVLVIGGGIAGCFAAIKAKEQGVSVTLVDKGYVGKSGQTPFAGQFGVFNPEWGHDFTASMNQVSSMGEYVNNPEWTEITLKDSYARFQDLLSWGVELLKYPDGEWVIWPPRPPERLAELPLQSIRMNRRKHAEAVRAHAIKTGVRIMDRIIITDLLKQDGNVIGAIGMPIGKYDLCIFKAKSTVMAAGTATLKPDGTVFAALTGDAEAMAYRAGAEITGKEWNDCHSHESAEFPGAPDRHMETDFSLSRPDDYREIPGVVNVEGDTFSDGSEMITMYVIPDVLEVDAGRGPIFRDMSTGTAEYLARAHGPEGVERQPIDLEAERLGRTRIVAGGGLGMSPHVTEGIWPVNTKCATQLPGLYAAGDSCGARQGGSRYPNKGFATMSCAVTGARAGLGAAEHALQMKKPTVNQEELALLKGILYTPTERKGGFSPAWTTQVLRNTMMPYWILYLKHGERLQSALTQVEFIRDRILPKLTAKDPHELCLAIQTKNMVLNAEMKLRASLFRTESRGTHYREDYPRRDDVTWLAWIKIKEEQGEMKLFKEPIPKKWWPDQSVPYEERYPIRFPRE